MKKIVLPKHSADVNEMNAVFEIYIESKDWVDSKTYKEKLMKKIGSNQYPSSYPKKAHIPLYYGFLTAEGIKSSSRRKITESGIKMYNAIKSDNLSERQKILLESLETMEFGRNNFGSISSDSDLDAPCAVIRSILDLGYTTCAEFSYMVWNIHDNGKKYYETINDIKKERIHGGIIPPESAKLYKDWKPILALERWGFLERDPNNKNRMIIHHLVMDKYFERLINLKIFNIDKHSIKAPFEITKNNIGANDSVFKPLIVSEQNIATFSTGTFVESNENLKKQNIHNTDEVLLVDSEISHLLADRVYSIKIKQNSSVDSTINLIPKNFINKSLEKEIINTLKSSVEQINVNYKNRLLNHIFEQNYTKKHMEEIEHNIEIEPVNLFVRLVSRFSHLKLENYMYILEQLLNKNKNYSDLTEELRNKKTNTSTSLHYNLPIPKSVQELINYKIVVKRNDDTLEIEPSIAEKTRKYFSLLPIYTSDIYLNNLTKNVNNNNSVKAFKYPEILNFPFSDRCVNNDLKISKKELNNQNICVNDYIIITDENMNHILSRRIYKVLFSSNNQHAFLEAKDFIVNSKENEILKELKK